MTFPIDTHDLAEICDLLGIIGFLTYVANYTCLSFRILSSESTTYFVINTSAAALVLISLTQQFNLAAALIQSFWIVLGIGAIAIRVRRGLRDARVARTPIPLHREIAQRRNLYALADRAASGQV